MMSKFDVVVLTLLLTAVAALGGVKLLENRIEVECVNKGHFTLAGETYLCRPIGKLTEGVKR